MRNIYRTSIIRDVKYLDTEHDIFDEDYTKEVVLLGIFKVKRTFTLRHDMSQVRKPSINGFKTN